MQNLSVRLSKTELGENAGFDWPSVMIIRHFVQKHLHLILIAPFIYCLVGSFDIHRPLGMR